MISLNITESQIFTILGNFIASILPANVEVFRAQTNRVPEPAGTDFVEMTPMFQGRLAMNIDGYATALFTGSISGNTLLIIAVDHGVLQVGSTIFCAGIAYGTSITALGTGTGGIGTYTINNAQSISTTAIQAGVKTIEQFTQVTVQLDVHGPASADNSQIISTLFRDEYALRNFIEQSGIGQFQIGITQVGGCDIAPLYTSDPRQVPFVNGEQQVEERWIVDSVMEVNSIVTVPQQFATAVGPVGIHDVI